MSGSTPTNSAAVDFEKQQATQAQQQEQQRQARLTQGSQAIDAIFGGTPEMADVTNQFNWSGVKAPSVTGPTNTPSGGTALPSGYSWIRAPAAAGAAAGPATGPFLTGGGYSTSPNYSTPTQQTGMGTSTTGSMLGAGTQNPIAGRGASGYVAGPTTGGGTAAGAGAGDWEIQGPGGSTYKVGTPFTYTTQAPTGKMIGGFGDDFFNRYKQQILDFYQPDEARQYSMAQRDLGYNLARSGLTRSSTAGDKQGELAYADALNKAGIVSNANQQTSGLRNAVQQAQQSAINQLYATEDPTLSANLAANSAKGLQLQNPTLTPAAALFGPALTAVSSGVATAASPYGVIPNLSPYGAVPTQQYTTSPSVASSGASSGGYA